MINYKDHFLFFRFCKLCYQAKSRQSAHASVVLVFFSYVFKENLRNLFLFCREFIIGLVCMLRERLVYPANSIIVADIYRFTWLTILYPIIPRSHQGVLKDGKLILI